MLFPCDSRKGVLLLHESMNLLFLWLMYNTKLTRGSCSFLLTSHWCVLGLEPVMFDLAVHLSFYCGIATITTYIEKFLNDIYHDLSFWKIDLYLSILLSHLNLSKYPD